MKSTNKVSGRGLLEVDFSTGEFVFTEVTKEGEYTYNFAEVLERFNGKNVSFSFSEDTEVEALEG